MEREFVRADALENNVMTMSGTIGKSLLLITTIMIAAAYVMSLAFNGYTDKVAMLGMGGLFVALIAGLVTVIARPKISPILSIVYSIAAGFALGAISFAFEATYRGIVIQAIACTFITMFVMLAAIPYM